MTYTLATAADAKVDSVTVININTLGRAFEKAVELIQYMDPGVEMVIMNDLGSPIYSIKAKTSKKFEITELS